MTYDDGARDMLKAIRALYRSDAEDLNSTGLATRVHWNDNWFALFDSILEKPALEIIEKTKEYYRDKPDFCPHPNAKPVNINGKIEFYQCPVCGAIIREGGLDL